MSETARCVNCGETHAVEMVGGLRVIGCPAMLADGSQIFLAEYVRDAEIGAARRNRIARDAFDEGHAARAFVATVASLPCVHGRKRADGPCPAYEPARDAVGPPMLVPTCPPCAARKLMASEERRP